MLYLAAGNGGAGSFTPLLLIILLFGVMYVMMIRPQQKRRREAEQMQASLSAGDRVVTIGGLHATVVSVGDDVVVVQIAPGVDVTFARPAIARVEKGDTVPAESTLDEPVVEEPAVPASYESPVVETKKTTD